MEVEGNTLASVQDASFLKKDAVVSEKFNNAVETTATGADNAETIKKSEADCSSIIEKNSMDKIVVEKDDLLEQIEEVCKEELSDQKNSEEISKTSEHEFLKKIDEIENNGNRVTMGVVKGNHDAKNLNVNNAGCDTLAIDAVIVGDRVLVVKDDDISEVSNQSPSATSSEDVKVLPPIAIKTDEKECEIKGDVEMLSKDTTVSSSTTRIEIDLTADQSDEDIPIPIVEKVESTGTHNLTQDDRKTIESMDTKDDDLEDIVEDKMEVDNVAGGINSEIMEIDAKSISSENNVEMLPVNTENEAKWKMDTIKENSLASEPIDVDMNETTVTITKETRSDLKPLNSEIDGVMDATTEPVVVHYNDKQDNEETPTAETTKPENKPMGDIKLIENIVSSSLTNTPVSSSNVFNSTPIQKQFEISSENVSKISDAAELSHTEKEEEEATSTKLSIKSFEDSTTESGTCATSETDHPSSDGTMKKYIDVIKKYNGMPDTTTDEEDTSTPTKLQSVGEKFEIKICNISGTELKKDSSYEVNVCCEQNDVRYLSIERVELSKSKCQTDKTSASESSVQSSSNGSVTSLPTYSLPQIVETSTSASTSSSTNCHSSSTSQNKHTIVGIEELCNFMIHQFTKIKQAINPESAKAATSTADNAMLTPTQQIKKNKKNSPSAETSSASASKTKRARKRSLQEDDLEGTPKAKQAKRDVSKETAKGNDTPDNEETKTGPCVLAKWVDKKFYAGKITAEKAGNKYVVLFEDGASKTLPKESIVFGESDILPLQDQQVYALVEEDYEIGTVLSIEKLSSKVIYTVKTETTTVKVTASDIYLEGDQAKEIQKIHNIKLGDIVEEEETSGTRPSRNKRPPASPSTPEAGYSGAVGKRGGKRQKRYS